jgi:uncharacterized protein
LVFLHSLLAGVLALWQATALQIPAPVGLVNDFAHVLPASTVELLTHVAEDVRTKSRGEFAIVTLSDLKNRPVEEVSLRIGREWKIGKIGDPGDPTRNAGVVILLVPKETNADGHGHCRIETGRGAEGFITDAEAGDICREATQYFMRRDYAGGLTLVTLRVAQRFADEFHFQLDTAFAPPAAPRVRRPSSDDGGGGIPAIVWPVLLFILLSILTRGRMGGGCLPMLLLFGGRGGRGNWGGGGGFGGGGGGGFGGFGGGGGFSGGGGGSSW